MCLCGLPARCDSSPEEVLCGLAARCDSSPEEVEAKIAWLSKQISPTCVLRRQVGGATQMLMFMMQYDIKIFTDLSWSPCIVGPAARTLKNGDPIRLNGAAQLRTPPSTDQT